MLLCQKVKYGICCMQQILIEIKTVPKHYNWGLYEFKVHIKNPSQTWPTATLIHPFVVTGWYVLSTETFCLQISLSPIGLWFIFKNCDLQGNMRDILSALLLSCLSNFKAEWRFLELIFFLWNFSNVRCYNKTFNTLRQRWNCRHFTDDTEMHFLES